MYKKKYRFLHSVIVVLAVAISCLGFLSKKTTDKKAPAKGKGFAVIELFTSEGCSSCPSADELVNRILRENKQDVYILSFHVDYWNRLGWKDAFSQPAFSGRQKQYARYLSLDGVYTPQIVVNGTDQFVGSDEAHLRSSLAKNMSGESDLAIEASEINNGTIRLSYKKGDNNAALLNIALIQPEATTQVKSGENGGKSLHHVNIVREFRTLEVTANTGSLDMEIPAALREHPFKVIAYMQQKSNFQVTGAAQIALDITGKHT